MKPTKRRRILGIIFAVTVLFWAVTALAYHLGAIGTTALIVLTFHLSWAAMVATVGTLYMEAYTQVEVGQEATETKGVCRHCGK